MDARVPPQPMTHYVLVCEYGVQHATCRCIATNKTVRQLKCDRPDVHAAKATT